MTRNLRARRAPFRATAASLAGGLIAAGTIVVVAPMASAADFTASDEESYYDALYDAMDNPGPDTIILDANITLLTDELPLYESDDDLTIDGNGFSLINGDVDREYGAFFAHEEGPLDGSFAFIDITFRDFTSESWPAVWVDAYGTVSFTNVTVEGSTRDGGATLLVGDDVTITDSTFTGNESPEGNGGGLAVEMQHGEGEVFVTGSTFTNNLADEDGGALYVDYDARLWIEDSVFSGNHAGSNGGAVFGSDDVIIESSSFSGNSTSDDESDGGGAVYADADASITSSAFTDNYSGSDGGALLAWFETEVTDSTFTDNEAAYNGGAIYVGEEDFTGYTSTFDGNTAGEDGGAVWGYYYADSFDSTWVGNEADGDGGAIYSDGDDDYSYSWNSTYVGNTAGDEGGAFYGHYYYYEAYHSTYTDNSADDGSHVFVDDDQIFTYASVYTANAGEGDACYSAVAPESWGYNFDQDGTCTDAWESSDLEPSHGAPLLGALAHNGGPTKTRLPAAGSVLIDAIPVETCEDAVEEDSDLAADQRGIDRPQGEGCDIGAVEVIPNLVYEFEDDDSNVIATATLTNATDWDCGETYTVAELGGTPPAGVVFPYGGFDFCIMLPEEGWSTTVTWVFPAPVTEMWKIDDDELWTKITSAVVAGNTVTYTITDGDDLDLDGLVDGYIYDPAAPGISAVFAG